MRFLTVTTALTALLFAPAAYAQGDPEEAFVDFVDSLEKADAETMRELLSSTLLAEYGDDGDTDGDLRLERHRREMFLQCALDNGYEVMNVERTGSRAVLTVEFRDRRDPSDTFRNEVEMVVDGYGWVVDKPPTGRPFINLDKGSLRIIGFAALGLFIAFIAYRKFFT